MYEKIRRELGAAERIAVVTGAGISQESGIPTFRGKDGLWRNHDPMELATIDAFFRNPRLVWEWYEERRSNICDAAPNAGHRAIAKLEEYSDVAVITQNIDGLHRRAGSTGVLELHGNIMRIRCTECDYSSDVGQGFDVLPPSCGCGAMLRPDVVWFGENLPTDVWEEAQVRASECDIMIVVGTSLLVSPANMLPRLAAQNNAAIIEVNPEPTGLSANAALSVRGTAADALPVLASEYIVYRG